MTNGFNRMNEATESDEREYGKSKVNCSQSAAWIEIELKDDDRHPVAGEPYWIKLPDDEIREGKTDKNGFVRIEGIPSGICVVKFPRIDTGDWQLPAQVTPVTETDAEKAWLEIELLDVDDQPVPEEAYWIKLPNDEIREGKLDQNGYARLEDIDPGTCLVKFPNIDENEIEKE